MAANDSNQITTTYQPSGNSYTYLRNFQNVSVHYTPAEEKVLESWGHDTSYPGQYCNTVVYGGVEIEVSSTLSYKPGRNPISTYEYMAASVNLAKPLSEIYNSATHFHSNMIFGQSVGENEPAKIVFEYPISGGTDIKWYKNGALVATDHSVNLIPECAIACVYSGSTVTKYAYVYTMDGAYWTSGGKTTAEVLQIINTQGSITAQNDPVFGWADEENGDFVLSKIFDHNGNDVDSATGYAGFGNTISNSNAKLDSECVQYNGYLGTEFITYFTGKDDAGSAWDYLLNNPASDGLELVIPSSDGHVYKLIWVQADRRLAAYIDGTQTASNVLYANAIKNANSKTYITWYRQSQSAESMSKLVFVENVSISGGYQYMFMSFLSGAELDLEEFDDEQALFDEINGYDPNAGQEDEKQDDPDDVPDPANDPLATGFLYAFMVDASDMQNLADCLVPETLSQKIRADFGNNLFDFIVSYHMMPCLTNASSDNKIAIAYRGNNFVYGENDTQLSLARITQTWYSVSCGTKVCWPKGVRENGFENWAQANVQLYLPFIGIVHLNTADVWCKPVTITYRFDVLQGTCVANIGVGNQGTIYTFEGTCKYSIPFTSIMDQSNQQLLSGIMSAGGAAISLAGVAGGNMGAITGAVSGVADAAGHFLAAAEHKSLISRGGNLTGSPGWNMPRKPALIITVPNRIQPGQIYNNNNGYPCHVSGAVGEWTNSYIEVGQIDLIAHANTHGAMPNDNELAMIKSQLKDGVYV